MPVGNNKLCEHGTIVTKCKLCELDSQLIEAKNNWGYWEREHDKLQAELEAARIKVDQLDAIKMHHLKCKEESNSKDGWYHYYVGGIDRILETDREDERSKNVPTKNKGFKRPSRSPS